MKIGVSGISALAVSMALAVPAVADEYIEGGDQCEDCRTIIVTGASTGYVAQDIVTATKTDTPILDVPQTIHVVTREQLDDQANYSLGEVLRYVPGTTVGQGEGNRDQITLRGQNTTADFFLDGVRDDVQYYRGLYNVERVEILKGPYALIFGRGGGGGIINRVQKTPVADETFGAARASLNSFGGWDLSADLNAPLGDKAAVRLNATYEKMESDRRFVDGERYAWNPYLAVDLSEDWKLGLSYEYVNDDRVPDRGVPSIATAAGQPNTPVRSYDRLFFGVPGVNRTTLEAHIAKLRLDGQLADNLKFTSTLLYGDYDKLYANVYANSAVSAANTVTLDAYSDPTKRENLIGQANLIWDIETGALEHKLLFGIEYGDQKTRNMRFNRTFSPGTTFNLNTPVYPTVTFTTPSRNTASDVKFFSAYVQDQIGIGDHFDIVVGLRYDHFQIDGIDFIPAVDRPFARSDDKISPRFGLIWKPQENVSIYSSFSRSFLPRSGDQFISLTTTQENLAPEKFTNYELGAKWDIQPNLNVTAALFQLDRSNATTPDPANPLTSINVGKTRTKGVELALTGRVLPDWQVSAGYTLQDGTLRGNDRVRLGQLPKHQFSLWNRYDVSDAFGVGLGMVHQSSQFAAIRTSATTTKLPSFTRFDAALFFDVSEKVQLQANVENLFDTDYFADAHNNNNITPGVPINGRVTVRVKF
ncbi:TonB-dependent siderophore receptor [uncultured Sphingorhabdus sp.]|uniref:TonB-dependent receptor n=1 Tax=uncultured Sphingorhabdus sp. TaxID=1686106 RepID=UPI00260B36BC|nr:TonB-dependent siderophore receptor [uncultured Sphingorhabdus sp.]HMS20966.1 TonB-dependent siderophore receptor [Sphingorhabdus sp.]